MNRLSNLLFGLAAFAISLTSAGASAAEREAESGFTSMFDGKSLKEWSLSCRQASPMRPGIGTLRSLDLLTGRPDQVQSFSGAPLPVVGDVEVEGAPRSGWASRTPELP